jgi:hypothetical protein
MPHIEYFLVSESISIDQLRNTVSLFHVFEELSFTSFPGRIPALVISTLWDILEDERGGEFLGTIQLTPPGDGEVKTYPFKFRTEPPVSRQRVFLEMKDLAVPGTGRFLFEVFCGDKKFASHQIFIHQHEGPPETGFQSQANASIESSPESAAGTTAGSDVASPQNTGSTPSS